MRNRIQIRHGRSSRTLSRSTNVPPLASPPPTQSHVFKSLRSGTTLDPSGDFIVFRNVDETSTKGLEFEVQHTGRRGLLARASYSLQRTENVETHQELSNSPRHLVKGNLSVPLLSDKVHAGVEVQYSSSARTTPGRSIRRADDYWVANLTLFSRELFRNLEVSATLYNLFDKRYAYPAGDEYVPELIWQDGRTFRVKLSYRF